MFLTDQTPVVSQSGVSPLLFLTDRLPLQLHPEVFITANTVTLSHTHRATDLNMFPSIWSSLSPLINEEFIKCPTWRLLVLSRDATFIIKKQTTWRKKGNKVKAEQINFLFFAWNVTISRLSEWWQINFDRSFLLLIHHLKQSSNFFFFFFFFN